MASSLSLKPFLVSTVVSCLSCRVMCRGMHFRCCRPSLTTERPASSKPKASANRWQVQLDHSNGPLCGRRARRFCLPVYICHWPVSLWCTFIIFSPSNLKLTIGWFLPLPLFILFILFLAFLYLHTDRSFLLTFRRALELPALNL